MSTNSLSLLIFPDADEATGHGFNYKEWDVVPTAISIERAVIVLEGTEAKKSTVDFICKDAKGNVFVGMITAELLKQVIAQCK